jgi:hypothetical protein
MVKKPFVEYRNKPLIVMEILLCFSEKYKD